MNIDQVVVTGTGSHRRMSNSPIPVKVLTGKDLKEASVTNFQDAMTKLNPSIVFMETDRGYDEYERIDREIRGYLGKR